MLCSQAGSLAESEEHLVRCRAILAAGGDWRGLAGRVALAEALSATACDNPEIAERWFNQALARFRQWSLPWSEAEVFCEWGRTLAAAGRGPLARQKFDAARDIYHRHEAGEPWLRRVDELQNTR